MTAANITEASETPMCYRHDVDMKHYKFLGLLTKGQVTSKTVTFSSAINGNELQAIFANVDGVKSWMLTSVSGSACNYKFQFRLSDGSLPAYTIGCDDTICFRLSDKLDSKAPTPDSVYGINVYE